MMIRTLAFLAIVAVPAVSAAQTLTPERIDDVRENARGHLGPFYVTPRIVLKELGVDSNVFNSAGEQASDFTFTLAPAMDVWVPFSRRALFKAGVTSDLVWYAEHESERSVNPRTSGRGEVYLGRVTLFGEHTHLDTRQRPNHEIDGRFRRTENTQTAGAQVALTPRTSIEVAGRRLDTRFRSDDLLDVSSLQRTLNRETEGLHLTGRHAVTPLTTIAVRYDLERDRFALSPLRDSDSYRVMPGVEFDQRALVKGSAYVGYRRFTPVVPGTLPEFSGVVGRVGLSYSLLGATVLGASYSRDLAYSYEEVRPFFVDQTVGASVRRALGSRFDVLVSADRHEYVYRNALVDGLPVSGVRHVDVTWNYTATLGHRIGREGRIGVGVSYWERESTRGALREYTNLRVITTLSYGF